MSETVTAKLIVDLLAQRHGKDVFVTECKDGPTQSGNGHLRMDAWAMARSWSNPCVSAYEVKVSRADFLQDEKWRGYLDYCNRFSFVCPHGVIQPEELSEGVGLVWVAKNGRRLFTKRKAAYRDVQIPESVFRYVLMCRADIRKSEFVRNDGERLSNHEYWRQWVEGRRYSSSLGRRLSKALQETIQREVEDVRAENERLKKLFSGYDTIRQLLERLGFDPDMPPYEFAVKNRLEAAREVIAAADLGRMRRAADQMKELAEKLESINEDAEVDKAA